MQPGIAVESTGEMCGIAEAGIDGSLSHGAACKDLRRGTQHSAIENIGTKRKTELLGEEVQKTVLREADVPGESLERNLPRKVPFDHVECRQHPLIYQNTQSSRSCQIIDKVFDLQNHLGTLGWFLKSAAEELNIRSQEMIIEQPMRGPAQEALV